MLDLGVCAMRDEFGEMDGSFDTSHPAACAKRNKKQKQDIDKELEDSRACHPEIAGNRRQTTSIRIVS